MAYRNKVWKLRSEFKAFNSGPMEDLREEVTVILYLTK
jgi:hypothetical protein